jgi:cysteine desulfuration protein SufE
MESPRPVNALSAPSHAGIEERVRELAGQLSACGTAPARLAWLIERARSRPSLPPEQRTDARLLPGCLSRLWLAAEFRDGRCRFACDSDSQIVRAVANLHCELADDLPPAAILAAPPDLPRRLGLDRLLTASRRAAQSRVWEHIQNFARRHAAMT